MWMIRVGSSLLWPRLLALFLLMSGTACADAPRDILLEAIKAGEQITAGELTVTFRGTRDLEKKPDEIKASYVGDLAFDREAKLLRWSVRSPSEHRDIPQHLIATPGECFYQQGLTLRRRSSSPKSFGTHRAPMDVRTLGRAPLDLVKERRDLDKVLEFFDGAKIYFTGRLPDDDDSIVRVTYEYPTIAKERPDKTLSLYHVEARYRIDTKRNVITNIHYSGIFEDTGMITPLHEDRFEWGEIDGVVVPTSCEQRDESRIVYDYLLDWKTVNKVDKARFDVKDLPPLDPMQVTVEVDEIDGTAAKVNYPPGFEKGRKKAPQTRPPSPPGDTDKPR